MLSFLQWLETNGAGQVFTYSMNNVSGDNGDKFRSIRSKWMTGHVPDRKKEFDPDRKFGKKKKKRKNKSK